uniref:OTU domain-containing protein n=1 Tax=Biomphalaria glabrata TaxID=6526 RepID=A0A2C9L3A4_BIOGL
MVRTQRSEFENFILRALNPLSISSLSRLSKSSFNNSHNFNLDHNRIYSPKDYRDIISLGESQDMFNFEQQAIWDSILHQNILSPERTRSRLSLEPHSPKSQPFARRSLLDSPRTSEVTVIPIIFEKSPSVVEKSKSKTDIPASSKAVSQTSIVIDGAEECLPRSDSPIIIDDEPNLSDNVSRVFNQNNRPYFTKDCLLPVVGVKNLVSPQLSDINSKSSSPSKVSVKSTNDFKDACLKNIEDNSPCPVVLECHDESDFCTDVSDNAESTKCFVQPTPSYPIYSILKRQLDKEERLVDYVKGDGNCFFRALSKLMYGSDVYHKAVRTLIVDIIATNKEKFAQFVDGEDVQSHVERMSEDHCWATTCEIYAAATLLQRDIYMLTPNHSNDKYSWLLFRPVFERQLQDIELSSRPCCYITLCNTNGNHYDRIVPNHGKCNCFLPHPQLDGICANVDLTET